MADIGEKADAIHLENGQAPRHTAHDDEYMRQHRENDDRADAAKGRGADSYDSKYWLSVNYIGTLFAIGVAFMGGIGGMCSKAIPCISVITGC